MALRFWTRPRQQAVHLNSLCSSLSLAFSGARHQKATRTEIKQSMSGAHLIYEIRKIRTNLKVKFTFASY